MLFIIFVVFFHGFAPVITRADLTWVPQLGTVEYPKHPDVSDTIYQGEVYQVGQDYFIALDDFSAEEAHCSRVMCPSSLGQKLDYGSYVHPKYFSTEESCRDGDIFYDEQDGLYYVAETKGLVDDDVPITDCFWSVLDDRENWMSLLRPLIGDMRLGDIVIPATHDSGTYGINKDSFLIDRNFLFQIADRVEPQVLVNWSITQEDDFDKQLRSGYREFDMRIADTGIFDGTFRWWHGLSGDEISEGLQQISQFAREHTEEILILSFSHFAAPGNIFDATQPISPERKDVISDMLLAALGDQMTYRGNLSSNPTVNEVLDTGRNIITVMQDSYILAKDHRYWESVIYEKWSGVTNTEDYFSQRSGLLQDIKTYHADEMSYVSGAITPDETIIVAGLINVYGQNETILDIVDDIAPGIRNISTENMSFEGLWVDLLSMARIGANTLGMYSRPEDLYSNGASVEFLGIGEQIRHWLTRPDLYKLNAIGVDDVSSSAAIDLAIQYNRGDFVREVSIAHQGNSKKGYYEWDESGFATNGGTDGLDCESVTVKYIVQSQGDILDEAFLEEAYIVDFQEGFYPPDSVVQLYVSSDSTNWNLLYTAVIQEMINDNSDVYLRGKSLPGGGGFAYLSSTYDDYGVECDDLPSNTENIIQVASW